MMITKRCKHFVSTFQTPRPLQKRKKEPIPIHHIIMDTYTRQQMDGGS